MAQIVIDVPDCNDAKSARAAIGIILAGTDKLEDAATELADKFGVEFYTGDYGNGRTYYPKGSHQSDANWNGWETDDEGNLAYGVWQSSSDNC